MKTKTILVCVLLSVFAAAGWRGAQVAYIRLTQLRGGAAGRIVTDNGTTAQWVSMSGDASIGSSGAVTVGKVNGNSFPASVSAGDLLAGSGSSALSRLAIGSAGQVLTVVSGLPAWAASNGLPTGGTTGQTLRMNGSTPTWNSVLTNDGSNVGIGQSPDSGAALSITGTGVQNGLSINSATNSIVTPVLRLQNTVGPAIYAINSATPGTSSGAGYSAFVNSSSLTNGNRLGAYNFGSYVSGVPQTSVAFQAYSNESWSSTAKGADLKLSLTGTGTTALTDRMYWYGDGDVSTYASGSEAATSATSGFLFIPTSNGVPTGSPRAIAGAAGIRLNRATNVLYASYAGAPPTPVATLGSNALTIVNASANGTLAATADYACCDTSGGSFTLILPDAAARGPRIVYVRCKTGGGANSLSLARAGSDTINGGTASMTLAAGTCVSLIPNGTDWQSLPSKAGSSATGP